MTSVQPRPYRLDVHEDMLDDLRERLARTRWPDEIPHSGWRYGTDLAFMRRLTERWQDGFDWRAQEVKLNAFDQFTVPLDGLSLHFIHQPGLSFEPGQRRLGIVEMADLLARLTTEILG